MGAQKVKEPKEKKKAEKPKPKRQSKPGQPTKKLKGKDWFVILAPSMFGGVQLVETPALDPKSVVGRVIESNASELMGQPNKYYMNLSFRIDRVENGRAYTQFSGFECSKEHLFRVVRKRSQKVRAVSDVKTKDGWELQIVSLAILNRNTEIEIQRKIRKLMVEEIDRSAKEAGIDNFVRSVTSGILQKDIRKQGNKIYPVRFSEIESIEVKKMGTKPEVKPNAEKDSGEDQYVQEEARDEPEEKGTDKPKEALGSKDAK